WCVPSPTGQRCTVWLLSTRPLGAIIVNAAVSSAELVFVDMGSNNKKGKQDNRRLQKTAAQIRTTTGFLTLFIRVYRSQAQTLGTTKSRTFHPGRKCDPQHFSCDRNFCTTLIMFEIKILLGQSSSGTLS
ncbi:hypothetical protein STEG23_030761, partial [Scotinomys teguina]